MKGSSKPRAGAVRKAKGKQVGSGGQGRQALEGKGPTPKAEDRAWHPAGKRKAAQERYAASGGKGGKPGGKVAGQGSRAGAPRGASGAARRSKAGDESEIVTGRNSVVEALRTRIPATTLYVAARIEMDDREGGDEDRHQSGHPHPRGHAARTRSAGRRGRRAPGSRAQGAAV
jgi:23S rRNA (guanosine2251-2'-O)-methyltransferase